MPNSQAVPPTCWGHTLRPENLGWRVAEMAGKKAPAGHVRALFLETIAQASRAPTDRMPHFCLRLIPGLSHNPPSDDLGGIRVSWVSSNYRHASMTTYHVPSVWEAYLVSPYYALTGQCACPLYERPKMTPDLHDLVRMLRNPRRPAAPAFSEPERPNERLTRVKLSLRFPWLSLI